jgi:hypothetical protein
MIIPATQLHTTSPNECPQTGSMMTLPFWSSVLSSSQKHRDFSSPWELGVHSGNAHPESPLPPLAS